MTQSYASNALLTGDGKRIKPPATLPDASKVLQVNTDGTSEHVAAVLESQRNAANGFVGLDGDSSVNAILRVRKDDAAEIGAVVLKDGELAIVEDNGGTPSLLFAGDGATAGGVLVGGTLQTKSIASTVAVSSSAKVELTDITLPIGANEIWAVDYTIGIQVTSTNNPGISWSFTGGNIKGQGFLFERTTTPSSNFSTFQSVEPVALSGSNDALYIPFGTSYVFLRFTGHMIGGASATSLKLNIGQKNTAAENPISVLAFGNELIAERLR